MIKYFQFCFDPISHYWMNILSGYKKWNSFLPGAYNPLTVEGTIVVDGIVASCYASYDHDLANWAVSPLKWFPEMLEWIFDEADEMVFVDIAKHLGKAMLPNNQFIN